MAVQDVQCPSCGNRKVVKRGKTSNGKQRYRCNISECECGTFINDYSYKAYIPGVKAQIIEMAMNASGVRDTARVLGISTDNVISELKKKKT